MARAALRPGLVVLLHKIGQGDARRVVATHVEANSLYNTPPTFSIYLMRNVFQLVDEAGHPTREALDHAERARELDPQVKA